jgi:hypothetical protein
MMRVQRSRAVSALATRPARIPARLRPRAFAWLCLAVASVACSNFGGGPRATAGGAQAELGTDTPVIGLQRGGHWSVLSIRPPNLSGQLFHLQLRNSVLTGSVSGGTAPAGSLRVSITKEGAQGFGPVGPVSLDFATDEGSTVVEGMWNGGRVHLVFAREAVRGTVTTNSFFYSRSNGGGVTNMESFRNPRMRAFGRAADYTEPLPQDVSCEYYLDQIGSDGALNGGSTCAGMPQQTRLEVPALAKTWLTHPELVTVLVAVLSAPPIVISEDYGPPNRR